MSCKFQYLSFFSPAELYKMVCEPDETDLDIKIPAVMLPQDAGASLEKMLRNSSSGEFFFYILDGCCAKDKFFSSHHVWNSHLLASKALS